MVPAQDLNDTSNNLSVTASERPNRAYINKHDIPMKKPSGHPKTGNKLSTNKKKKPANSLDINTNE